LAAMILVVDKAKTALRMTDFMTSSYAIVRPTQASEERGHPCNLQTRQR
jgi:hypothetical protein